MKDEVSDGGAGSGLLHPAVLPEPVPLRRMPDRAPHGERAGNRVSGDAVGRRGHFSEGRFPLNFRHEAPPGNVPSGSDRQSFEFTQVLKRSRRPGMEDRGPGNRSSGSNPRPGPRTTTATASENSVR